MGDFETRAVRYFQRWTAHEFSSLRTHSTVFGVGLLVPFITWAIAYRVVGDSEPWVIVSIVTLLYFVLAPVLVAVGRQAALRAGTHAARVAEQLTHDIRGAAGWDFLVHHFRSIHPLIVHTSWFREILQRALVQCDRPASHALARWLAMFPPVGSPPQASLPVAPPMAAYLREQGLSRLQWLQQHLNSRALASANRVRSARIFPQRKLNVLEQIGVAFAAGTLGLGLWAFLTGSHRLNALFFIAVLGGIAAVFGYGAVRLSGTDVASGRFWAQFDRKFNPVRFWTAQTLSILICGFALWGLMRLLPLFVHRSG